MRSAARPISDFGFSASATGAAQPYATAVAILPSHLAAPRSGRPNVNDCTLVQKNINYWNAETVQADLGLSVI